MTAPTHQPKSNPSGIEGSQLGPYLVGSRLGAGGAASVHLGIRVHANPDDLTATERLVGIKVIHDHLAIEREFVAMFLDEARVALQLVHPNIVRTYEMGQEDERLFLAMEYLHGHSLHEVFVRGTKQGARLPVDLVAWIGAQVARALHYAHSLTDIVGTPLHLVHRDVSPRNVFITYDGDVKLIDFGIAQAVGRIAKTKVGQMKGTFSYIAPERALGGGCDHRADIFSLGVALFEAATGRRLFRGDDDVQTLQNVLRGNVPDPCELREGFPRELKRILLKALAIQPDRRYSTAEALAQDLDAFVAATGLEPPKPRMALLMSTIFAEERAGKDRAIERLCRQAAPEPSDPLEPTPEASNLAVSRSRPASLPPSRGLRPWLLGALATVVAASAAFVMVQPLSLPGQHIATAPALTPPAPTSVTIDVSVVPAVEATFALDGNSVTGSVARFHPSIGTEPITLHIRALGFEDARVDVIPDENRTVVVPLRERVAAKTPLAPSSVAPRTESAPRAAPRAPSGGPKPKLTELLNKRH